MSPSLLPSSSAPLLPFLTPFHPPKGWELHLQAPVCSFLPLLPLPHPSTLHLLCLQLIDCDFPPRLSSQICSSLVWTHSPPSPRGSFNFTAQHFTWRNVSIMVEFQASGRQTSEQHLAFPAGADQEFGMFRKAAHLFSVPKG